MHVCKDRREVYGVEHRVLERKPIGRRLMRSARVVGRIKDVGPVKAEDWQTLGNVSLTPMDAFSVDFQPIVALLAKILEANR